MSPWVMPSDAYAASAVSVVNGMKMKEIRTTGVKDIFDMGEGHKALTLHVEFRDPGKTLDASFLKEAEDKIIELLDKAGYHLRS